MHAIIIIVLYYVHNLIDYPENINFREYYNYTGTDEVYYAVAPRLN